MADEIFLFYDLRGRPTRSQPDPPPRIPQVGSMYGALKTGKVYEYVGKDDQRRHVYREREQVL